MKKLIAIVSSILFVTTLSAKAEMGIGVSGAMHFFDAEGEETTRQSNQQNSGDHSHDVLVPEIFVEMISDNGSALGLSYIPTRELGSKSRSDSNSDGDTGTYTAKAELENVLQVYADVPAGPGYVKVGIQHVELATLESLNSGTQYPNKNLFGATVGYGFKGDLPYGTMYYKAEGTYTMFEQYKAENSGNKVSADLTDAAVRLSLGYKF